MGSVSDASRSLPVSSRAGGPRDRRHPAAAGTSRVGMAGRWGRPEQKAPSGEREEPERSRRGAD